MLVNDGEMSIWSYTNFTIIDEHFTIINEHFTIISLKQTTIRSFDHHWEASPTEMAFTLFYIHIICILFPMLWSYIINICGSWVQDRTHINNTIRLEIRVKNSETPSRSWTCSPPLLSSVKIGVEDWSTSGRGFQQYLYILNLLFIALYIFFIWQLRHKP